MIDLTNNEEKNVRYINLKSLNIIGSQDNLMTKILNSVKVEARRDINKKIQTCYQNNEGNIDDVNLLAWRVKKALPNKLMNLLSFSLYWPSFLATLNSPHDLKRRDTIEKVCIEGGHWNWWILTAGLPQRNSPHWEIIKKNMMSAGIVIRNFEIEKNEFVVLDINGVKCEFKPHNRPRFEWTC